MTQELPIEGPAEAELNRLIEMLGKNEVIVRYQEAEENTKDNRALEQLVETIKKKPRLLNIMPSRQRQQKQPLN